MASFEDILQAFRTAEERRYTEDDLKRSVNKKLQLFAHSQATALFHKDDYFLQRIQKTARVREDLDKNLKPEDLVDIQSLTKSVNQTLDKKFLLCRLLVKPLVNTPVVFVVEDSIGKHAVTVVLYFNPLPISLFSPGTYLTILNPTFKVYESGCIFVPCYDPNEVIVLARDQISLILPNLKWHDEDYDEEEDNDESDEDRSVMDFRNEGNKLFVAGKYEEALKIYSDGLDLDPNNVELLSNRSLCLLRLEKYEEALENALQCLKYNPVHEKAIYRAGQAYFGLNQYEKARDLLTAKMELLNPPIKVIEDLLAKAKERILQRDHGINEMSKHDKDRQEAVLKSINEGNKLFAAGKYEEALKIYSDGLVLDPDNVKLLSNRSLCSLRLEKYEEALDTALQCLKGNPVHEKVIYLSSQAYFGLGQYEKARDLLSAKMELLNPPSKVIKDLLAKAKERILQRDQGIYNMPEFYKHCMDPVIYDIAEYYGPVKIDNAGEKGRGLFATKDVEAGTLLLCCKAFAHYIAPPTATTDQVMESFIDLVVEKIKKNPEKGKDLYQLWAGKEMGTLDPKKDNCTVVDRERIRCIVKYNSFKDTVRDCDRYYLFITPSYTNNDCIDVNCPMTFYGDVCIARSAKPLKKGQEVLFRYTRDIILDKNFNCVCALCKFESQEPIEVRLKRDNLLRYIHSTTYSKPNDLAQDIKIIRELSDGSPYSAHYLIPLLYKLGKMYCDREQYREAMKPYEELLRDWRNCSRDYLNEYLRVSVDLFTIHHLLKDIPNAKKVREDVLELTKICFGSVDLSALELIKRSVTKVLFDY